jgi:hypothetical protein
MQYVITSHAWIWLYIWLAQIIRSVYICYLYNHNYTQKIIASALGNKNKNITPKDISFPA